jgi:hypothetical protein
VGVNSHHRKAAWVLAAGSALDACLGVGYGFADHIGSWHGAYCATATATTVGCDIAPRGWLAYLLAFAMLVTIVPLFGASLAFFTTGLMADHVDKRHEELKGHLRGRDGGRRHA